MSDNDFWHLIAFIWTILAFFWVIYNVLYS